jgi:hypothetical protein
MFREKNKAK